MTLRHGDGGAEAQVQAAGFVPPPGHTKFGYMFAALAADPANRLPADLDSALLDTLALEMVEKDGEEDQPKGSALGKGDAPIPAAYTYFGQFVDHDITRDVNSGTLGDLTANPIAVVAAVGLENGRSCRLDLDSVYNNAPRNGDKLVIGRVTPLNGNSPPVLRVPGKSDENDLPRDTTPARAAIIGDSRNDENLVVAQMHVAFLKAHNALVNQGLDFDAAMRALRRRYQWIVLHDYLPRIVDPVIAAQTIAAGPRFWRLGDATQLFMPLEFSAAAFRLGHSMIRRFYRHNLNFLPATLDQLFEFTTLSGTMRGLPTLPDNWIIEWEHFLPLPGAAPQNARTIETRLTSILSKLPGSDGQPLGSAPGTPPAVAQLAPVLAGRNLRRGVRVGLPTGQAVARHMGLVPLEGTALLDTLPTQAMRAAATPFQSETPLWFYILAEAGNPLGPNGRHLGPVGSHILCDTFWNLVRFSNDSVLNPEAPVDFAPFTLADLVAMGAP